MQKLVKPIVLVASLGVCTIAVQASAQQDPVTQPGESQDPAVTTDPGTPSDTASPETPETSPETSAQETPPTPVTETNCSDGVDDDGDGLIDCADSDCADNDVCKPKVLPEPAPELAPAPVAPVESTEAKADDAPAPPPESTIGIEGFLGLSGRLGGGASGYEVAQRAGLTLGLGVLYALNRVFGFGVSYGYSNFGSERLDPSLNAPNVSPRGNVANATIDRGLHSLFLMGRAYPLRSDKAGLWAGLHLGVSWQTAAARGAVAVGDYGSSIQPFSTNAEPKAGFSIGASIGGELELGSNFAMLTSVNFTHHRLTSDPLDTTRTAPPIPGVGASSQLDWRLALQYRFDVSGGQPSASVSASVGE